MARDSPSSYFYSSQPSSSQSRPDDDDEVDRAFWQSTPTCLEELRQRTDDECPLLSQPLGASLTRDLTAAVSDDRDAGRARAGPAEDDDETRGTRCVFRRNRPGSFATLGFLLLPPLAPPSAAASPMRMAKRALARPRIRRVNVTGVAPPSQTRRRR
ncbi:hypothetical protein BC826DRAFT_1105751 [Russula brevipes]|nr:hypothetical protein BC826DRAFT_1105751 [Russula brevipes]